MKRNVNVAWLALSLGLGLGLSLLGCGAEPKPETAQPAELVAGLIDEKGTLSLSLESLSPLLQGTFTDGLSVHRLEDERGHIAVAVASLERFTAGISGIGSGWPNGITTQALMAEPSIQLAVGSGFVTELNALTPVGLLQIDGVVVSKIQRHGYTRVLGIDDQRIGVIDHLSFERGLFPSALQAGPGIVEQGKLDILPRDRQRTPYFRAVVGTCGDRALFAASLVQMNLYNVGEMLLEFAGNQSLACDEVVNLAGDREAVLALRQANGDVVFIGNPRTSKAAMVTLSR